MIKDKLDPKGVYIFEYLNESGEVVRIDKQNIIVQNFIDAIWDFLDYTAQTPSADVLDINYLALGEGTTAAQRSDTVLEDEYFRKTLATKSFTDSVFTATTAIGAGEGNPTGSDITEVGIYANGTATLDSGTLISRAIIAVPKNANIQLNVTWTLTI